ncbi:MAG: endonuclease/exonuclease/phosphatase family protein [Planctomycetota bacterium]
MHLRLLSWNVHKCTGGLDRRYDPARTARVLLDSAADVALLQEVAEDGSWYRAERQVDVLGDLVGMPHRSYFVNVRFGARRGSYGNAILSRFPIATTENLDLTQPGRKARSVVHGELRLTLPEGGTRTLHVFNLHLGLGERERRRQLVQFLAAHPFAGLQRRTPIVVAGDFNDVWGTLGPRLLKPAGFVGAGKPLRTFPAYAPLRALDGLYVRGSVELESLRALRQRPAGTASDHLPLLADLRVHA